MNTLRTVFAFVVLVCAIAFASAAYVVTQQTKKWRTDYFALEAKTNDEIKNLKKEVTDRTDERDKAVGDVKAFKAKVEDISVQIGAREATIATLTNQVKDLEGFKKTLEDRMAEVSKQLETQTNNNTELSKKCEEMRLAKEAAEKAQRDAEDKQRGLEDDVAKLRDQLKITTSKLDSAKQLNDRYAAVFGDDGMRLAQAAPSPAPVIDGKVKNVDNPMRLVAISVGKDDGVRPGMLFEVVRPSLQQYVGRVRVLDVQDEEAICRIDTAMTQGAIVEGDHVTTRIR